jgi:DNA-binding protein H-NS
MTDQDLNTLSLADLKVLQKKITKAIAEFDDRKKSAARVALEAHAKDLGYSLAEIMETSAPRTRAAALPKYRHPENSSITWSGRGRKPHWFADALAAGKSPQSLMI